MFTWFPCGCALLISEGLWDVRRTLGVLAARSHGAYTEAPETFRDKKPLQIPCKVFLFGSSEWIADR